MKVGFSEVRSLLILSITAIGQKYEVLYGGFDPVLKTVRIRFVNNPMLALVNVAK